MNDLYTIKLMQLEKAKGELRALYALWFETGREHGGEVYSQIKPMIEKFINTLSDHCG